METAYYTKNNEDKMLERYILAKWKSDEKEFIRFKKDLEVADTSVREIASSIESFMAVHCIDEEKYGLLEPVWLAEHQDFLVDKYGREKLLLTLQKILIRLNYLGYPYTEEIQILQYVWGTYKK